MKKHLRFSFRQPIHKKVDYFEKFNALIDESAKNTDDNFQAIVLIGDLVKRKAVTATRVSDQEIAADLILRGMQQDFDLAMAVINAANTYRQQLLHINNIK